MIPLDGKIISGETTDEAAITGEPIPKDKRPVLFYLQERTQKNGFIEMETTTSPDTTFAKIIRLTFEAAASRSDTQKFIQRFSKFYTPSIITMAVLVFAIPVLFCIWTLIYG
jgi:Cd2+/Zn2+-exporting ATPase